MERFYHIPEHGISLVCFWPGAVGNMQEFFQILAPWTRDRDPAREARPLSDLGELLGPAFGCSVSVLGVSPWRRVGSKQVVAFISVRKFV